MLKVHPAWIIFAMMANAFLLYIFTEVSKLPRTPVVVVAMMLGGGLLASLGVLLGLVTSKVSVVTESTTVTTTATVPEVKS